MKTTHMKQLWFVMLMALMLAAPMALADWGTCGVALTTEVNLTDPNVASDGAGGAYVVWNRYMSGDNEFHLQRVNASGTTLWEILVVDNGAGLYMDPLVLPDGSGGALLAWMEAETSGSFAHIRAQRIDSDGTIHTGWTAGGVRLSTSPYAQQIPVAAEDGAGGLIVAWEDWRPNGGSGNNIYAQHITGSGSIASGWPVDGLEIISAEVNAVEFPSRPVIAADGSGGAVVAWTHIDLPSFDSQLYAKRVTGSGGTVWQTTVSSFDGAYHLQIMADGATGTIVTWHDDRNGNMDIFAQKISSAGNGLWTTNGLAVCTDSSDQSYPKLATDGAGGAIIAWTDYRSTNDGVFAQSVSSTGTLRWTANGTRLGSQVGQPEICARPGGGAIAIWMSYTPSKTYIQAVDQYGLMVYSSEGEEVCSAYNPKIASDGNGGAIYVWESASISANRLQWDLSTTPNQTIVDGSYSAFPGVQKPNYLFDWVFNWKTNGYTDPTLDQVVVGDPKKTSPTCAINVGGQPNTLTYGMGGVVMAVKPNLDGTYQHTVTWLNRDCVTPCSYLYSLYSTFNGATGSVLNRKLMVLYCVAEGLPFVMEKSAESDGVQMSAPTPNPFNPQTVIRFFVPTQAQNVSLSIYDLAGHKVKTFGNGISERQWVERTWMGTDDGNRRVGSGVYFAILEVDGERFTEKLAMLK